MMDKSITIHWIFIHSIGNIGRIKVHTEHRQHLYSKQIFPQNCPKKCVEKLSNALFKWLKTCTENGFQWTATCGANDNWFFLLQIRSPAENYYSQAILQLCLRSIEWEYCNIKKSAPDFSGNTKLLRWIIRRHNVGVERDWAFWYVKKTWMWKIHQK